MIEDPNYAAAVWLLPRLAASMLEGRPVAVATLTEEITLVADADDAEALTVILALADQHLADSHQMASVKPYAWDGADWKPVDLVARGVNPLLVSHVNHLFAQQVYAGQADPLREYFAVQDREIRVSPYDLFEDGSGAVTSVTAWTQGAVAALPRTDRLFLAPADGEGVMVPYAAAMEVLDDGVQDAGLAPARMIARAFPSGRRWRALQRLAL
jgi:hypothetical protein